MACSDALTQLLMYPSFRGLPITASCPRDRAIWVVQGEDPLALRMARLMAWMGKNLVTAARDIPTDPGRNYPDLEGLLFPAPWRTQSSPVFAPKSNSMV